MCKKLIFLVFVVLAMGLLGPAPADANPNIALWYKLDESAGLNAEDSSSYDRDGTLYQWPEGAGFTPGWDPDGGHSGGCLTFNDDTKLTVPKSALSTVTNGITVSLWLKDAWRVGQNCVFDAGASQEAIEEFRVMAFIGTAPDAEVLWRAGNDSNDTLRWDLEGGSVENLEGWHHWTFVKDETAGNISIYFDGSVAESNDVVDNTLATVLPTKLPLSGFDFLIGGRNKQMNDLQGTVDEFVVYDRALSDDEVERLYYTASDIDLGVAWKPDPADDAENICSDVVLSWTPGDYAAEHDVYFGTDFDGVNSATDPYTPPGRGRQTETSYDAGALILDLGVTYYWRIDEVNDPCLWKRDVWQFTTNDGNAFDPDPADGQTAVLVDSILTWSAGCNAASHNVYFGTDFGNVNTGTGTFQGNQDLADTDFDPHDWDPCGLDYETTYYWRIEEVNGMTTWKGQVWSFSSGIAVTDPNFLLWYKLDETEGYMAYDSSNYQRHGLIHMPGAGPPDWDADGQWGGSLSFDDDTAIWVPTPTLSKLSNAVTVILWAKNGSSRAFQANGGDSQLEAVISSGGGQTTWRAGNDTNDVLACPGGGLGWHHWAFIKDEGEGTIKIYFDGFLAESNDVVDNTLIGVRSKPFKIGGETASDNDFKGNIDDFIVYDRALSEGEVARQYETGGPVGEAVNAWMPTPRNGAIDVPRDVVLTWKKGDCAQDVNGHDVYFGTSFNDVTDANTTETLDVYKGSQDVDANSYTPGILELDTTYYWRIDEVNETDEVNSPWKGPVWRFRVANFLIVDDMEDYNDIPPDRILDTWHDWSHYDPVGGQFPTSAEITLETTADANVHGGRQSMKFQYNNTDVGGWMFYRNISEIDANTIGPLMHLEIGQDWTILDMKILTLHFIGHPDNDATEQMYVALADSAGHTAVVPYGYYIDEDMNDIKKREWTEWNIALEDFNDINDVDVTDVNNVYIGFGNRDNPVVGGSGVVFFDDIRLHPAKCVPARRKPASDLSNNCIVDLEDIEIMANHWLRGDANLLPVQNPGTTGLVGHWKLDGNADDSSIYNNHGTVQGKYSWVTGHIGTGALEFTGSGGRVLVPDAAVLRPTHTVSVSVWVNFSEPQNASRVVVKGKNDAETYEIEVEGYDSFIFLLRDFDKTKYQVEGPLWPDEWFHLAGTYDGLTIKCYLNGRLVDSKEEIGIALSQDTTGLAIGNKSDALDRVYIGTVDDVRVYNRGLSADEVEWLASKGTGYVALTSPANIYDEEEPGEKKVNFRDYAVMVDKWLEEKMWPPE